MAAGSAGVHGARRRLLAAKSRPNRACNGVGLAVAALATEFSTGGLADGMESSCRRAVQCLWLAVDVRSHGSDHGVVGTLRRQANGRRGSAAHHVGRGREVVELPGGRRNGLALVVSLGLAPDRSARGAKWHGRRAAANCAAVHQGVAEDAVAVESSGVVAACSRAAAAPRGRCAARRGPLGSATRSIMEWLNAAMKM